MEWQSTEVAERFEKGWRYTAEW